MKVIIVYDSAYGNTEKVARAIAGALKSQAEVELLRVSEAGAEKLKEAQLVVVGSPTQGFSPTKAIQALLNSLPANVLKGVSVAAFDTRMVLEDTKGFPRWMLRFAGFAAPRVAQALKKKGGILVAPPEGFIVMGKEGPLKDGEMERAAEWAKDLLK